MFCFSKAKPRQVLLAELWDTDLLAVLGRYVPGLLLSYFMLVTVMMWPLAVYHRLWDRAYVRLKPALQRLDFSVRGYMMSKQRERQLRRRALHPERAMDNHSDSEEELAAFCPQLDDSTVARNWPSQTLSTQMLKSPVQTMAHSIFQGAKHL